MGSWSVYCGISKIAITANQECVLIPLKKNSNAVGYGKYVVATLPIFGNYDDYGGLEDIVRDENTALIEEHFNCTIDEFTNFFTRGCIDKDDVSEELSNNEELKEWTFMFVDKKVYDFMSTNIENGYDGRGHLPFGNKSILELIGFKFIKEDISLGRYKYVWEFDNVEFFSDDTWLNCDKGSVHNFTGTYSSLSDYVTIPEEKKWIGDKATWELWEYIDDKSVKEQLFYSLGENYGYYESEKLMMEIALERTFNNIEISDYLKEIIKKDENKTLVKKYINDYKKYGKLLCDLRTMTYNFHPMSFSFEPYILYLTPQCGEYQKHQKLLDKFSEINKSYINNEDDEL